MAMIYSTTTGKDIGDPDFIPIDPASLPGQEAIKRAFEQLILSASGWRKVFASKREAGMKQAQGAGFARWSTSKDVEDSLGTRVDIEDLCLAALMAKVYGDFILKTCVASVRPAVLLGLDTRPTGPALGDIFARVLLGMGIEVRYCFIVAAPEIMAYAGTAGQKSPGDPERADGFVYISASHNPPGHNGVKFGLSTGGVLSAIEIAPLIEAFKTLATSAEAGKLAFSLVAAAKPAEIAACYGACARWKRLAGSAYTLFSHRVATGIDELSGQMRALDALADACGQAPLGIVAELNGSARSTSIDEDFLGSLGVRVSVYNNEPGVFARRIVPEGESLALCASLLDESHAKDPAFELGYAPDCDGDRGNLVFFDQARGHSRALEAQEVFALSCLTELADLKRKGIAGKVAVAVNEATSLRIDAIASRFGAKVFRAETGEANVVNAARELREAGWIVPILGEGSNGGTIVHPSKVRDPLSTVGAMVRILRSPDRDDMPGILGMWLAVSRLPPMEGMPFLSDIIATLPRWASTSVFEERAALRVKSRDKRVLKDRYSRAFGREWAHRSGEFHARFGFERWSAWASVGTREFEVGNDFAASGSGGIRIVFHDASDAPKAFLFMRGSGTEPVFRIMADIEGGSSDDEAFLLGFHTSLVREADE